jgi:hypothetical protein
MDYFTQYTIEMSTKLWNLNIKNIAYHLTATAPREGRLI